MQNMKRLSITSLMATIAMAISASTPITGASVVPIEDLCQYVSKRNPSFDCEIAQAFDSVGRIYGLRGDIALCQAIVETGWFRYGDGTAVTPDQHNYCGLGVTTGGSRGCSFETVADGVTAMIQHLYAYATTSPLPDGALPLDPRFGLVTRGSATSWEDLSGRWAANPAYADIILDIYRRLLKESGIEIPEEKTPKEDVSSDDDIDDNPYFD